MHVVGIGSAARGDSDRFSDRDVLIVGLPDEIAEVTSRYKATGTSVVSLTPRKFAYLAAHGSLFLKHAIDEGVCLSDNKDGWRDLSRLWSSNGDYSHEIESNLNLLSVLQSVPTSAQGASAAMDIMVCSVRNILIRKLASRGIFKFSWIDLAWNGKLVCKVPGDAWKAVLWAREQKNRRRAGMSTSVNLQQVIEFAYLFRDVLDSPRVRWTSSNSRIESVASRFEAGSYAQLRAYELLCANAPNDAGLKALKAIVSQPSYFCSRRTGLN